MKRSLLAFWALLLAVSTTALGAPPERVAKGHRLISRSDPAITIQLPRSARYVGADRWDLYGICDAELHLFVEADRHKNVTAFYWIQFERYLPNNTYVYDYTKDDPVSFAGRPFWKRVRFGSTNDPQKPGSDGEHVHQMLARAGYKLPPNMNNVRLVHLLDEARRQELMFIYAEASDALDESITERAMQRIRIAP